MIPSYAGGKFPLTTYLASQVRAILADPKRWAALPTQVCEWLEFQQERSLLPGAVGAPGRDLSAPRQVLHGRLPVRGAAGAPDARHAADAPAGAGAARGRSASSPPTIRSRSGRCATSAQLFEAGRPSLAALFDEDMLGDDLEAWLAELLPAEAHVPELRHHLRADRAPPSRPGEDRPAGDRLDRPRLRRAAHATSPTTSSCRRRAPTPRPGSSTSAGSAKCSCA